MSSVVNFIVSSSGPVADVKLSARIPQQTPAVLPISAPTSAADVKVNPTLSTPISVDPSDDSRVPSTGRGTALPAALIAGVVVLVSFLLVVIVTAAVSLAVCLKNRIKFNRLFPVSASQAYDGILQDNMLYNYPPLDLTDTTKVRKNEAYAYNIVTERNDAYLKTVTSVNVSETVDTYECVQPCNS